MDNIIKNSRLLFLIDGLGAVLSAFLLGVILTRFESSFGMPRNALYILAFLPCLFAAYDFICYFWITQNWKPFFKIIAFANLIYCGLSIGFLFYHYQEMTILGWIYFLLELVIVLLLVKVEFKVISK